MVPRGDGAKAWRRDLHSARKKLTPSDSDADLIGVSLNQRETRRAYPSHYLPEIAKLTTLTLLGVTVTDFSQVLGSVKTGR